MKRITILVALMLAVTALPLAAKTPKWYKSQKNSVVQVIAYDIEGNETGRSNGFFISADGTGITDLSILKGAWSAVTVDAAGISRPIQVILGANDMYDVARFQVTPDKKLQSVSLAQFKHYPNDAVFILREGAGGADMVQASVQKSMEIDDSHFYYNLSLTFDSCLQGCPVIDTDGQTIGIVQAGAATDTVTYCLDAAYVRDIEIQTLSLDEKAYQNLHIRKALPADVSQALAYVYIKQNTLDSKQYGSLLEDFLVQFPDNPDGLFNMATYLILETDSTQYGRAEQLIDRSISVSTQKDRVHCDYANLIYTAVTGGLNKLPDWTLDKALDQVDSAISIDTVPTYYQLKGNIEFALKRYPEALASYRQVNRSSLASTDTYLFAYTICSKIEGSGQECVQLLDTAITMLGTPMPQRAGTLLIERATLNESLGEYRKAVQDYNSYEKLIGSSSLNEKFYYLRHQAEINAKMYQQAMQDIETACLLAPQDSSLMLDHASLLLRVGQSEKALPMLLTLEQSYPESPDIERLIGVCYMQQEQNNKAKSYLEKASALGDQIATQLLEKL